MGVGAIQGVLGGIREFTGVREGSGRGAAGDGRWLGKGKGKELEKERQKGQEDEPEDFHSLRPPYLHVPPQPHPPTPPLNYPLTL